MIHPIEELLVAYYIKDLLTQIAMWVERARKESLQGAFSKAIQVKSDMFFLKENLDATSEQASTSCRKSDSSPKPAATSQDPINMSELKKLLQRMSSEMVDLKNTSNENQSNNRGFNRPPFRRPNQPPQNPPPPNPSEGFTSEEILSVLKALAIGTQDIPKPSKYQSTQESQPPQEEEGDDQ